MTINDKEEGTREGRRNLQATLKICKDGGKGRLIGWLGLRLEQDIMKALARLNVGTLSQI